MRQEDEARAVRAGVGQRERDVLPEERIRRLNQNARAVARVRFAAAGAAVLQIDQDLQRLAHDVVRARALHVHDEADATRVALVLRAIQTLTGRGHLGSEHGRPILQFRAALRKYNDLRLFMHQRMMPPVTRRRAPMCAFTRNRMKSD